jgi:glutathione peroxidase
MGGANKFWPSVNRIDDVYGDRNLFCACVPMLGSEAIKWNFTKFLVDRTGEVVQRYAPATTPDSIARDIEELL